MSDIYRDRANRRRAYDKGIGAARERERLLNPKPICARQGCEIPVTRTRSKCCSEACARLMRRDLAFPGPEKVRAEMIARPLTTYTAVGEAFNANPETVKGYLARHGIDLEAVRQEVADRLLREQPFRQRDHILSMLRRGRLPQRSLPSAPRERSTSLEPSRFEVNVSGRSIVEYWQTPECDRWMFHPDVRQAAERRMRR